jgi:DNA-binding GntR family transcriptional regulator
MIARSEASIADQVYEVLNRAIESGRFAPGARVHEDEIARDLGISKTPLRLALHQLRRDGVVRIEPRKGIYLAVPTLTEIIELIEVREVLEGLAARRAALQVDRSFVGEMEACLRPFSEENLGRRRLKYAAADHRLHSLMVKASGSAELIKALQVINIRLHQHRLDNQTVGHDLRPIHRQHLGIIRALKAGDAEGAERLARDHVHHQLALKMLKESEAAHARHEARAPEPHARLYLPGGTVLAVAPRALKQRPKRAAAMLSKSRGAR